jgi:hypothetical protein
VIDRLAEPLPDPELVDEADRADAAAAPIVFAIRARAPA